MFFLLFVFIQPTSSRSCYLLRQNTNLESELETVNTAYMVRLDIHPITVKGSLKGNGNPESLASGDGQ